MEEWIGYVKHYLCLIDSPGIKKWIIFSISNCVSNPVLHSHVLQIEFMFYKSIFYNPCLTKPVLDLQIESMFTNTCFTNWVHALQIQSSSCFTLQLICRLTRRTRLSLKSNRSYHWRSNMVRNIFVILSSRRRRKRIFWQSALLIRTNQTNEGRQILPTIFSRIKNDILLGSRLVEPVAFLLLKLDEHVA